MFSLLLHPSRDLEDILIAELQECGTAGVAQEESGLRAFFESDQDAASLLERIWIAEVGDTPERPNFDRIVKDGKNNIRDAVNSLQVEILAA